MPAVTGLPIQDWWGVAWAVQGKLKMRGIMCDDLRIVTKLLRFENIIREFSLKLVRIAHSRRPLGFSPWCVREAVGQGEFCLFAERAQNYAYQQYI